jgi:hypothetical protein
MATDPTTSLSRNTNTSIDFVVFLKNGVAFLHFRAVKSAPEMAGHR